jgi:AmpD protein
MHVDGKGLVSAARQALSPNHDERPDGGDITLLVVHSISLPPGRFGGGAVEALFGNTLEYSEHPYFEQLRGLRVSAHFFVRRNGELIQFVSCDRRAWHAGQSTWKGRERCNDFSIGVELEGADDQPFADLQYLVLARLALALKSRYPIEDLVGHADIAPGRKTDPGPFFDWGYFRGLLETASSRGAL